MERFARPRRLGVVLAAAAVVAAAPATAPPAVAATANEYGFHTLINDVRVEHDVRALGLSRRITRYARKHSHRMASQGKLFHSELESLLASPHIRMVSENVGYAYSLEQMRDTFLDSPPHRENILRPRMRRTGVGIVVRDGVYWVTEIIYR